MLRVEGYSHMKKFFSLAFIMLVGCGTPFDGSWKGAPLSASGLTFDFALKMTGNTFESTVALSAGSPLLTTTSKGTYTTSGSGDAAKITFTTTETSAKDGSGAAVTVTPKTCEAKSCQGFEINLGGQVDCTCATNTYSYMQSGDSLVLKAYAGADVTFTRSK